MTSSFLFSAKILLLGWCLTACVSSEESADCRRFKTGHFVFSHNEPGLRFHTLIDRTDSQQTETDLVTGDVSVLTVKWRDACTYELKLLSSTKPFSDAIQHYRKTVPLQTQILATTDRYYVFRCWREGDDLVLTDTLWVR